MEVGELDHEEAERMNKLLEDLLQQMKETGLVMEYTMGESGPEKIILSGEFYHALLYYMPEITFANFRAFGAGFLRQLLAQEDPVLFGIYAALAATKHVVHAMFKPEDAEKRIVALTESIIKSIAKREPDESVLALKALFAAFAAVYHFDTRAYDATTLIRHYIATLLDFSGGFVVLRFGGEG